MTNLDAIVLRTCSTREYRSQLALLRTMSCSARIEFVLTSYHTRDKDVLCSSPNKMYTYCTRVNRTQHMSLVTKSCSSRVEYTVRCPYVYSTNYKSRLRTMPAQHEYITTKTRCHTIIARILNSLKISPRLPATIAHEVSRAHYDLSTCTLRANHELSRASHIVVDRTNIVKVGA